jgi:hypothetical protein
MFTRQRLLFGVLTVRRLAGLPLTLLVAAPGPPERIDTLIERASARPAVLLFAAAGTDQTRRGTGILRHCSMNCNYLA